MKKLTDFFTNPEKMDKKDLYIVELETEVGMHRNLLQENCRVKTDLETKLEVAERDFQQLSKRIAHEVEERFRKEIRELNFIIDGLRRENESLAQFKAQKVKTDIDLKFFQKILHLVKRYIL